MLFALLLLAASAAAHRAPRLPTATQFCHECLHVGRDQNECGALVTRPGAAPRHDSNHSRFCKCVRSLARAGPPASGARHAPLDVTHVRV